VLDDIPAFSTDDYDRARRFTVLIDALYEHRVKLVASAAVEPDRLYAVGQNAPEFKRTASRLMEMQSQEYLALPHLT
jgi:cell division protein ZapE